MLSIVRANQFKRDVKRLSLSGSKAMDKLKDVIKRLIGEEKLDPKYRNHLLKNNWKGFYECHIEPDWLLIYRIHKDRNELELARTGSHSDLF
jgi:mRNA interferase YafQ